MQVLVVMTLISEHVLELACYIALVIHIIRTDREVAPLLMETEVKRRWKQNVITLANQSFLFFLEILGYCLLLFTIAWSTEKTLVNTFNLFNPILSIATLITSGPLRETTIEMLGLRR